MTTNSHGLTIKVGQTLRLNGNKRRRHIVVSQADGTKSYTLVDEKGTEIGLWDCETHFCVLSSRRFVFPRIIPVEIVAEPTVQA